MSMSNLSRRTSEVKIFSIAANQTKTTINRNGYYDVKKVLCECQGLLDCYYFDNNRPFFSNCLS